MYDIDTILAMQQLVKKEIDNTKEHIVYNVKDVENLAFAKGKLNGLELLLQDLKDLQKGDSEIE
tara:strand:- start:3691 stop:3882 length:192 start_codon:yes stop_codon:yes gene_type:complete